jgi:proteasome activator subunit 4
MWLATDWLPSLLQEKATSGWLAWSETTDWYLAPGEESPLEPWEAASRDAVGTLREVLCDPEYWPKLKIHYSEENNSEIINQDNVSFVKSICMWNSPC